MEAKEKSPYRNGADNGLLMGAYLSLMFGTWAYTLVYASGSMLSLIAFALLVGVPFVLYAMLRRTYVRSGGSVTNPALWVEGIMTFIFGAIIATVVGYVFMRYVWPDYLAHLYSAMIEQMRTVAESSPSEEGASIRQMADQLVRMRDEGLLPDTLSFLIDVMWFVTFWGCILSLIEAPIVRAFKVRKNLQ